MERLLDPKNDWAFKQLFGEEKNKRILISFLNDVLDEHVLQGNKITNVTFLKVELDSEIAMLRQSIVDVLCKTKDGTHFILEMQKASDSGFIQRAVEYASRVYLSQRPKEKKKKNDKGGYKKMRPVIFLAVMEETLFPHKKAYLSHHQIRDIITCEHDMKQMSFSFLELSKFHKEFGKLETNVEKWVYFFKHAENIEPERLKEILKEKSALGDAYKALERSGYTMEQLLEYDRYRLKEEEIAARLSDAEEKGAERERKKAEKEKKQLEEKVKAEKKQLEEKAKAEKIESAKNLLKAGISVEIVANSLGLSPEEVRKL